MPEVRVLGGGLRKALGGKQLRVEADRVGGLLEALAAAGGAAARRLLFDESADPSVDLRVLVNGRSMVDYFPREVLHMRIQTPFEVTGAEGRWDVVARIDGGGVAGQADALRHGIARALQKSDEALRAPLKRNGLLTRDARKKERKKYGQRGARARYQFSKR